MTEEERAYHEAGHCVIGLANGDPVLCVSIVPVCGHEAGVVVEPPCLTRKVAAGMLPPDADASTYQREAPSEIDRVLAGDLAVRLRGMEVQKESRLDEWISDEADAIIDHIWPHDGFCRTDTCDYATLLKLARLISQNDYSARHLLQDRARRTAKMLYDRWPAVEALAAELLRDKAMDGAAARTLCATSLPTHAWPLP